MVFLYGTGEFGSYRDALAKIGQQVLVSQDVEEAKTCSGLLLPGGGDIHGALDERESRVIRLFVGQKRPILGICRGMQALNVFFGGTLYDYIPRHQSPQGDLLHPTRAAGLMTELLGTQPVVNSNHHQAVREVGRELVPCQWAEDGTIAALRHKSLPIWGVQWHPERLRGGEAIFRRFADEMRK